jgi:cytochrome c oxidase subunit 2
MFKNWMFHPVSPQELQTSNLFIAVLIIAAFIFALVCGVLLYSIIRFRARPGWEEPTQQFGVPRLEIAWTAIPIVLLLVVFGFTVRAMNLVEPSAASGPDDIVITGHQWWWEIYYPGTGVVTANEIHLPVGKKMQVRLESDDVIHGLWLPQLGGKIDLVPGQTNHMWLEADKPGVYLGSCSQYCGVEHAWMQVRAIAQTPAQFAAWEKQQAQPAVAPTGALAIAGNTLFGSLTCASCHALYGTPYQADIGPNLTHLASRQTLAAGLLTNTAANLKLWLKEPQELKPDSHMPDLHLSTSQVAALTAYLEELK